jgi:hypothetical protein
MLKWSSTRRWTFTGSTWIDRWLKFSFCTLVEGLGAGAWVGGTKLGGADCKGGYAG